MDRKSSNPDQDFCAGYEKVDCDWRNEPPLPLDDLFRDPVVHERVGKLIANAMHRSVLPGWY
jgi:hypothetical protein